jgi:hypothetical protein
MPIDGALEDLEGPADYILRNTLPPYTPENIEEFREEYKHKFEIKREGSWINIRPSDNLLLKYHIELESSGNNSITKNTRFLELYNTKKILLKLFIMTARNVQKTLGHTY